MPQKENWNAPNLDRVSFGLIVSDGWSDLCVCFEVGFCTCFVIICMGKSSSSSQGENGVAAANT